MAELVIKDLSGEWGDLIEKIGARALEQAQAQASESVKRAQAEERTALDLLLTLAEAFGKGIDLREVAVDLAGCDCDGEWSGKLVIGGGAGMRRLLLCRGEDK